MSRPILIASSSSSWVLIGLSIAASLGALLLVLSNWLQGEDGVRNEDAVISEPVVAMPASDTSAPWPWTTSHSVPGVPNQDIVTFYPSEVLNNPECSVHASGGAAVVLVPDGQGIRFGIVDADGVRHAHRLSYSPGRMRMARRANGSMLVGFGDLVREEPGRPGPGASWPVSIYLDGQRLVESDPIWKFGIAGDGSSYYLIEPLAGDTSQLIIRNLDEGSERVHFLDDMATSYASGELPYSVLYSWDDSEVLFRPGIDGDGTHYFYPAKGARRERREIRLPEGGQDGEPIMIAASFPSSGEGFVTYWIDSQRFLLVAYERDWNSKNSQAVERWSRVFRRPDSLPYHMTLSDDGTFVLLEGWTVRLLDASTGKTRLAMPIVDEQAQLERLGGTLGANATSDQIGSVGGVDIVGQQLQITRQVDSLDGRVRDYVYDIYDLEGIELDSPPTRRVSFRADTPTCSPRATSGRLRPENGRLVFGAVDA